MIKHVNEQTPYFAEGKVDSGASRKISRTGSCTNEESSTQNLKDKIEEVGLEILSNDVDLYTAISIGLLNFVDTNERYRHRLCNNIGLDLLMLESDARVNLLKGNLRFGCIVRSNNQQNKNSSISSFGGSGANATQLDKTNDFIQKDEESFNTKMQMISNFIGLKIIFLSSSDTGSVNFVPGIVQESQPLHVAHNDTTKHFLAVGKSVGTIQLNLHNHMNRLVQNVAVCDGIVRPRFYSSLPLFGAAAYAIRSSLSQTPLLSKCGSFSHPNDIYFNDELAVHLKDLVYHQIKSNLAYYSLFLNEQIADYGVTPEAGPDRLTDTLASQVELLHEMNYYPEVAEDVVLNALADVLQCAIVLFFSEISVEFPQTLGVYVPGQPHFQLFQNQLTGAAEMICLAKNEFNHHYDEVAIAIGSPGWQFLQSKIMSLINTNQFGSVRQMRYGFNFGEGGSWKAARFKQSQIAQNTSETNADNDTPLLTPNQQSGIFDELVSMQQRQMRVSDAAMTSNTASPQCESTKKVDIKNKIMKTKEKIMSVLNKMKDTGTTASSEINTTTTGLSDSGKPNKHSITRLDNTQLSTSDASLIANASAPPLHETPKTKRSAVHQYPVHRLASTSSFKKKSRDVNKQKGKHKSDKHLKIAGSSTKRGPLSSILVHNPVGASEGSITGQSPFTTDISREERGTFVASQKSLSSAISSLSIGGKFNSACQLNKYPPDRDMENERVQPIINRNTEFQDSRFNECGSSACQQICGQNGILSENNKYLEQSGLKEGKSASSNVVLTNNQDRVHSVANELYVQTTDPSYEEKTSPFMSALHQLKLLSTEADHNASMDDSRAAQITLLNPNVATLDSRATVVRMMECSNSDAPDDKNSTRAANKISDNVMHDHFNYPCGGSINMQRNYAQIDKIYQPFDAPPQTSNNPLVQFLLNEKISDENKEVIKAMWERAQTDNEKDHVRNFVNLLNSSAEQVHMSNNPAIKPEHHNKKESVSININSSIVDSCDGKSFPTRIPQDFRYSSTMTLLSNLAKMNCELLEVDNRDGSVMENKHEDSWLRRTSQGGNVPPTCISQPISNGTTNTQTSDKNNECLNNSGNDSTHAQMEQLCTNDIVRCYSLRNNGCFAALARSILVAAQNSNIAEAHLKNRLKMVQLVRLTTTNASKGDNLHEVARQIERKLYKLCIREWRKNKPRYAAYMHNLDYDAELLRFRTTGECCVQLENAIPLAIANALGVEIQIITSLREYPMLQITPDTMSASNTVVVLLLALDQGDGPIGRYSVAISKDSASATSRKSKTVTFSDTPEVRTFERSDAERAELLEWQMERAKARREKSTSAAALANAENLSHVDRYSMLMGANVPHFSFPQARQQQQYQAHLFASNTLRANGQPLTAPMYSISPQPYVGPHVVIPSNKGMMRQSVNHQISNTFSPFPIGGYIHGGAAYFPLMTSVPSDYRQNAQQIATTNSATTGSSQLSRSLIHKLRFKNGTNVPSTISGTNVK